MKFLPVLLALGLSASSMAQDASPSPAAAESRNGQTPRAPYPPAPDYPVPYGVPDPAEVKEELDAILARLENAVVLRVVHSRTREEITDFTKPVGGAVMDRGAEWKFQPLQYPLAVAYNGALLVAEVTGDKRYADFATGKFEYIAAQLPKFRSWPHEPNNPFIYFIEPDSLDAVGAMGAAMVKARRAGLAPDMKETIDLQAKHVRSGQYRLADGTLARKSPRADSIWADDLYMSVPLLAQMGAMTGDAAYFDEGAKQLLQIGGYLFRRERGLFAHTVNTQNQETHVDYFWGRANGWCMMAAVELLDVMPENHPRRAEVLQLLRAHAEGVAQLQSGEGLWRQLLDRGDSYLESSCTGMFVFALARAVNRGWLDPFSYGPVALAGWGGLSARFTDDGRIDGTCVGTNYGSDAVFYSNRPATDDVHGYGPAFLAGAEVIRLVTNDQLTARVAGSGAIVVEKRRARNEPPR